MEIFLKRKSFWPVNKKINKHSKLLFVEYSQLKDLGKDSFEVLKMSIDFFRGDTLKRLQAEKNA
jgi:hypothetical protein